MNIKDNTNWIKTLSDKKIYEKHFSEARMLFTNTHIPLIKELKDKILATYVVTAKFKYLGYNGDALECNGQTLVYAKNKTNKELSLGKNVIYLDGNLKPGGSHKYPRVAYSEDNYCILEFISFGLPYVLPLNGWDIEIITIINI